MSVFIRPRQADVAASIDFTGAASLGGDWVLETNAGAIETKTLISTNYHYILTDLSTPTGISTTNPQVFPGHTAGEWSNSSAFAAIKSDGSVITWGGASAGGNSSAVATALNGSVDAQDVVQLYSTKVAFAALRKDGSVITWGSIYNGGAGGGNSSAVATALNGSVDAQDVVQLYSTNSAFAALRKDGSVITWGTASYGGDSTTATNTTTIISNVATALNGSVDAQDVV